MSICVAFGKSCVYVNRNIYHFTYLPYRDRIPVLPERDQAYNSE